LTDLVDVLAGELRDELVQTLGVDLSTDGGENGLDILSGGRGVAAEGEEKVGCEVLHDFCGRDYLAMNARNAQIFGRLDGDIVPVVSERERQSI
jgi:hypothetical protein